MALTAATLVLAAMLPGCARLADTGKSMFVSSTPAVAMVGSQLLQGQLQVYTDYTGFIALESETGAEPLLRCSGRMPVTGSFSREIDLRCSNGAQARLALSLRTDLRGFAYGGEGDQAVSLAFGLGPDEMNALLKLPPQTTLAREEGRYVLVRAEASAQASGAAALPPAEAAGALPSPPAPRTP